jgi:hypothetical protein
LLVVAAPLLGPSRVIIRREQIGLDLDLVEDAGAAIHADVAERKTQQPIVEYMGGYLETVHVVEDAGMVAERNRERIGCTHEVRTAIVSGQDLGNELQRGEPFGHPTAYNKSNQAWHVLFATRKEPMEKITFTADGVCVRVEVGSVSDIEDPRRRLLESHRLRYPGAPPPILCGPPAIRQAPNSELEP